MSEQVLIIGAGPSGLATAIQLKRYGIEARLFEGQRPGGLLWNANLVENYPGFPGGVSGPQLVRAILQQAEELSIQPTLETVQRLDWSQGRFQVETEAGSYTAPVAVVASGTQPRPFPEGLIPQHLRDRVCYEVRPLLEMSLAGQQIAIIGAGDAAFDYALNLSRHNQVLVLNRGEELKCLPLLWERAIQNPRIVYHAQTPVTRLGRTPTGRLALFCQSRSGPTNIEVDYLLGAIGRIPQMEFITSQLRAYSDGLEAQGVLYYVGDVKNGIFRQTAIAVGDGLLAAMKIYQVFEEKHK